MISHNLTEKKRSQIDVSVLIAAFISPSQVKLNILQSYCSWVFNFYLFICLFIYLSIYLFIYLFILFLFFFVLMINQWLCSSFSGNLPSIFKTLFSFTQLD